MSFVKKRFLSPQLSLVATGVLVLAACSPGAPSSSESSVQSDEIAQMSVEDSAQGIDQTELAESSLWADYLSDYSLVDEARGTITTVSISDGVREIVTNALPNHETGEFPNAGNPNAISAQDNTWQFPSEPTYTGVPEGVKVTGVALNGIKFDPGTGERVTCSSGETYNLEALQEVGDLGLDFNNAHVQPGGEYHYHGVSELLVSLYDSGEDLVLVGFAADGHLIYYSKSGAFESSYSIKDSDRSGEGCVYEAPLTGTSLSFGSARDGSLTQDWEYVEASGDLDQCNGTTINGKYAYVLTDTYPYIPRCLMGAFEEDVSGGGVMNPPPGDGKEGDGPPPMGGERPPGQPPGQDGPPPAPGA